tara:strand:- start:40 stop:1626 length:1587 start_codon:yes stop_codon:yes gene_type:complete
MEAILARLDELERSHEALKRECEERGRERDEYKRLYQETMERCRRLELGLLGQKSERHAPNENQLTFDVLSLALESRAEAQVEALAEDLVRAHRRRKRTGRTPIPENLPRVEFEVLPEEVKREGLDAFTRIGEETSEVVERRPSSMVVVRVIRPKFLRKAAADENTEFLVGDPPSLPIAKGMAGPSLLADTIVRRWQDHLPLHRLEGIYKREGFPLARSTMCTWHQRLAESVAPVVAAMRADAFETPYLCVDATGVLVQAKEKCKRSHFWVLIAPEKHVLFEYTKRHTKEDVDGILAGYRGTLLADAHSVYDHLYDDNTLVEANCWAHARRYFYKALEADKERAERALSMVRLLFDVERHIQNSSRKKRESIRDKHSRPVVERFFSWCDHEWEHVLEGTPIYDAIRYARNQREGLVRFLSDGRLPIHNNDSERALRRQAVGRKNWLFVGSDDGGRANATFTSLLASCRMHAIDPLAYLRDILCLVYDWPEHRMLDLSPMRWAETSREPDVIARLEANPFRQAAMITPA